MTEPQDGKDVSAAGAKRAQRRRKKAEKSAEAHETGWSHMTKVFRSLSLEGIDLYRVSLKGSWQRRASMLIVLCGETDEGPVVAFHSTQDVLFMWVELSDRIKQGKLDWRHDEFG